MVFLPKTLRRARIAFLVMTIARGEGEVPSGKIFFFPLSSGFELPSFIGRLA